MVVADSKCGAANQGPGAGPRRPSARVLHLDFDSHASQSSAALESTPNFSKYMTALISTSYELEGISRPASTLEKLTRCAPQRRQGRSRQDARQRRVLYHQIVPPSASEHGPEVAMGEIYVLTYRF